MYSTFGGAGSSTEGKSRRFMAWGFAGIVGCAITCLVAVSVLGQGAGSGGRGSVELLCSDGRCGEGSKLSMQGAVKDLDKWADKSELKDRLDELQTTMERGMSHKVEVSQLNSYFAGLDRQVKQQRLHALRQERKEGMHTSMTLASVDADAKTQGDAKSESSTAQSHATGGDAMKQEERADDSMYAVDNDPDEAFPEDDKAEDGHGPDSSAEEATARRGRVGLSSISALNQYFDKQASHIKKENTRQLHHKSKMSARQAEADLDSYFDSLEKKTGTKDVKLHSLEKEVKELRHEVHGLRSPVESARDAAASTGAAVKSLHADDEAIMALEKANTGRREEVPVHRKVTNNEIDVKIDAEKEQHRAPARNPRVHSGGLPAGWKEYRDLKTKYPYWYNSRTGKSTWVKPGGGEQPGVKLLQLLQAADSEKEQSRRALEARDKQVALKADHGVYGHHWGRSQWADKGWMSFLDGSNVHGMGSIQTNSQRLDSGREAADHAMLRPASSSHY